MKLLILGGTVFLGRHLVIAALEAERKAGLKPEQESALLASYDGKRTGQ